MYVLVFFFFFQAEDGIRDVAVTGVQTCALPISSTQVIVVDAWRIESADDGEEQGLLASAYQFSYRLALLTTDSVILIVAAAVGWRMSYGIYGACMTVGMIATWFAKEPERADAVMHEKEREAPPWAPPGFV